MKNGYRSILVFGFMPLVSVFFGLIALKNMYFTFFLYHFIVCLAAPAAYYLLQNKKISALISDAGINKTNLFSSILAGIISGIIFASIILLCFGIFRSRFIDAMAVKALLESWKFRGNQLYFLIAYFIVFNSIVEELFWRGFLCAEFNKLLGITASSALVSFFFVQYHCLTIFMIFGAAAALIFVPVLFLVSMFWCYTRYYFRNPYAAIISHLAADLGIMAVYLKYVL
jgi:uncharacterized protein